MPELRPSRYQVAAGHQLHLPVHAEKAGIEAQLAAAGSLFRLLQELLHKVFALPPHSVHIFFYPHSQTTVFESNSQLFYNLCHDTLVQHQAE